MLFCIIHLTSSYLLQQAVKAIIDTKNKSSPGQPFIFVKHHNFFDFSEFGYEPSPVYMNFVRHPVERIISWYIKLKWWCAYLGNLKKCR